LRDENAFARIYADYPSRRAVPVIYLNGNAEPTFTDNFKHRRTHRPTRTTG
jgi:hypothetical protein